jgi:hypothetical protein
MFVAKYWQKWLCAEKFHMWKLNTQLSWQCSCLKNTWFWKCSQRNISNIYLVTSAKSFFLSVCTQQIEIWSKPVLVVLRKLYCRLKFHKNKWHFTFRTRCAPLAHSSLNIQRKGKYLQQTYEYTENNTILRNCCYLRDNWMGERANEEDGIYILWAHNGAKPS